MCGRFTLRTAARQIAEFFELMFELVEWDTPRFNIAPTQSVLAVRRTTAGREPALLRWGLIPSWSKDTSMAAKCINARGEELANNRMFRTPFRRSRCLIVADGFYEWDRANPKKKVPLRFSLADDGLFAFAGLMDRWSGPTGEVVESCSVITTEPNALVQPIHNRMPVILHPDDYDRWLDPLNQEVAALQPLLTPFPAEAMRAERVSEAINNAKNDVDPRLAVAMESPRWRARSLFDEDDA
jgi:putative SOS response-associated peptidase YedK